VTTRTNCGSWVENSGFVVGTSECGGLAAPD
jgi:hypothetical protein